MKHIHPLFLVPLLSVGLASIGLAQSAVPNLMNYQAHVTESDGTVLGAAPTPVNRLVHFKFWKSATSIAPADLLYSETQTVTINNGDFSVLIGNGGSIGTEPHVFANAFSSADVFLGLTVDFDDNGSVSNDTEISPRQQIVSTAFAMRAKVAEGVDTGAITETMLGGGAVTSSKLATGAVGASVLADNAVSASSIVDLSVGTLDLADNAVTFAKMADSAVGSAELQTNAITNVKMADNSIGNAELADNAVGTNEIVNFSVTAAKLATNVGVFSKSGNDLSYTAGKVQIGTSSSNNPFKITANGAAALTIQSPVSGGYGLYHTNGSNNILNTWVSNIQTNIESTEILHFVTNGVGRLSITKTGLIGIGTANPTRGLVEISGSSGSFNLLAGYGLLNEDTATANGGGNYPTDPSSLYCTGGIKAAEFIAPSDARIKRIVGRSDGVSDLALLEAIEITDYSYLDTVARGERTYKKVIAQQVEAIYPQAVQQSTDVVPDIYRKAGFRAGWVALATDLEPGDRVRLVSTGGDAVHEVLAVEADRFLTNLVSEAEEVFVYGREVTDFRNVDYEAIAMLNVSATQELARRLEARETEVVALRNRLADLEAKDQVREARLAAMEKRFSDGQSRVALSH